MCELVREKSLKSQIWWEKRREREGEKERKREKAGRGGYGGKKRGELSDREMEGER
jgi:hypothetical protein